MPIVSMLYLLYTSALMGKDISLLFLQTLLCYSISIYFIGGIHMKRGAILFSLLLLAGCANTTNVSMQTTTAQTTTETTTTTVAKKTGTTTFKDVQDGQDMLYRVHYVDNIVKTVDFIAELPIPNDIDLSQATDEQKAEFKKQLLQEMTSGNDIKGISYDVKFNKNITLIVTMDFATVDFKTFSEDKQSAVSAQLANIFRNNITIDALEAELVKTGATKIEE